MSGPTEPDGPTDPVCPDADARDTPGEEAVVDARGLRCPLPVIRLARLVSDHPALREVTVLTTDPAAAHDIPAWCRMREHAYLGARDCDGHTEHRVGVRPKGQAGAP